MKKAQVSVLPKTAVDEEGAVSKKNDTYLVSIDLADLKK